MKLRWHLLFLLFATLAAIASWLVLSEPLWEQTGHDAAYYVTHHQKEGELISLLVRNQRSTYTVETRKLEDGRILKTVDLDLSRQRHSPVIIPHEQDHSGKNAIVVIGQFGIIKNGSEGHFAIKIFDAHTGKLLTNELLGVMADADFSVRGNQVAIPTPTQLILFDSNVRKLRKYELPDISSSHISPDGKWVVITQRKALRILDWESGKVLATQKLKGSRFKLCFDKQGSMILLEAFPDIVLSRWSWDRREIKLLKKETRLEQQTARSLDVVLWHTDSSGKLHMTNGWKRDWPQHYRALCERLSQWGVNVSSYYDKQFLKPGYVLDENFAVLSRYEEPLYGGMNIDDRWKVEYTNPAVPNGSIIVRHQGPIWPNAMAIGVVFYLLIYVLALCLGPRPENVPEL